MTPSYGRTDGRSVVHSPNSRERLNITRQCMTRLLAYHQVPASFLEFIFSFARSEKAQAFLFGAFRHEIRLCGDNQGLKIPQLNRSGNTIQICFNIRAPAITGQNLAWRWSVQQTAIYHSFDIGSGQSIWILLKGDERLADQTIDPLQSDRFPELRRFKSPDECFATALKTLGMFGQWANENWQEFVHDLEVVVRELTDPFLYGTPNLPPAFERAPLSIEKNVFGFDDVRHAEVIEERVNDAILILKTLKSVFEQMRSFYLSFLKADGTPESLKENCRMHLRAFELAISGIEDEMELSQARLQALLNRLANRKQMVR